MSQKNGSSARREFDWTSARERIRAAEQGLLDLGPDEAEIQEALRARAAQLARAQQVAATRGLTRHLAFWVGEARCAVDLELVGGVVTPQWITRLPTAPGRLSRVIQVQGTIVPVASLVEVLGVKPRAGIDARRAVLLSRGSRHLALLTHRAEEIVRLNTAELSSPERDVSGLIRGIAPDMTIILDGEKLLDGLTVEDHRPDPSVPARPTR